MSGWCSASLTMSSWVIAVVSASNRCGAPPQRSATFSISPGAEPLSRRRSVGSISTIKPLAVATCTFQAGAAAPSGSRIIRASGSLTETLGSPFLASSVACVFARSAFSCTSSASFCCACLTRRARSSAACKARLLHRRSGSAGSVSSSLFSSATRSATAFSMLSSRLALLIEPRPACARTLVPSIASSSKVTSFSAISPVTLWVSRRSNNPACSPKRGQQIVIDRGPAAQPAIGRVLLTQAVDRPRRADPLQRRIKPDRQHHPGIGGRPAGNRVARLDPLVKLAQIQTFDKRPNQPRPVVVWQLAVQIDHVPAQLRPVRADHPHSLAHSGPPLPPLIGLYRTRGANLAITPRIQIFPGLDYSLLRRDYRHDADHLRLRRQPVGIEAVGRPDQDLGHPIE